MMETVLPFLIFWGVWILIPIVVDGFETFYRIVLVFLFGRKTEKLKIEDKDLPRVSVVIPVHNEELIVDRCLNSLKIQNYPHDKLEVIVVDDGSTDKTRSLVENHVNGNGNNGKNEKNGNGVRVNGKFIPVGDFTGVVKLVAKGKAGKASALNTGISHAHGDIIVNIDCDVVLAPDAVRCMVEAFIKDENLGAATGDVEISADILEERDEEGNIILDESGEVKERKLSKLEEFLTKSQFLEYISAFRLGREAQDITRSMYTLSGAFSAFRRDTLLKSSLYRTSTVSEDTDLTLDVHRQKVRVGFVKEAKAYLEPILDWDDLYSQRLRWHRGEMEVCGLHRDMVGNRFFGNLGLIGLPKMLLIDHSMAFPRLLWIFLLPILIFYGYSASIIFYSILVMYLFYVALEFINTIFTYLIVDEDTKERIKESLPYALTLPLYRLVLFYFRMSGYLVALTEPPSWDVPGPVNGFKNGLNNLQKKLGEAQACFLASLMTGLKKCEKTRDFFSQRVAFLRSSLGKLVNLILVVPARKLKTYLKDVRLTLRWSVSYIMALLIVLSTKVFKLFSELLQLALVLLATVVVLKDRTPSFNQSVSLTILRRSYLKLANLFLFFTTPP
jgi:cellulose synthase/poly-beta-1,6-N-acetylglucosamine synthase-like glycosyltransferase